MSALGPLADSSHTSPEVREVPKAASCTAKFCDDLLDHLVGEREQRRWNFEAEPLRGAEREIMERRFGATRFLF
jgi:hypothetical protein